MVQREDLPLGPETGLDKHAEQVGGIAGLNNPQLWTADRVANLTKDPGELVSLWNTKHPDDPVVEK
jgi:hypothetical protein